MTAAEATILQPLRLEASFDLLDLHRFKPHRYPHLLQTVSRAAGAQAYDILFAFPGDTLQLNGTGIRFISASSAVPECGDTFLDTFNSWWRRERRDHASSDLPFCGGWFLYLSYELCAEIEPVLSSKIPRSAGLIAMATRFRTAVVYDHSARVFYCIGEPGTEELLKQIHQDIALAQQSRTPSVSTLPIDIKHVEQESPQRYMDSVVKIKRYIREGDIFQANLSRGWRIDTWRSPVAADLYSRLRTHNPAPFAGLSWFDDFTLLSSSPERLLKIRGGVAETRPIAGTRPRGFRQGEDEANLRELISHPKERAEHIMLLDLERNDLGRVCKPGSIHVNELMALESYAHVHHIVSNIRGELRAGVEPGEAIKAVFPGGTITGCPKIRCMEILAELEERPRGPYTGSIGYVNLNCDMDLNILIRTIMIEKTGISLRAGAGIVADSEPARELEETQAKAKGMLHALGIS
ncbi:MAG TPA: aminodeoxychorismate synthase component I [Gammaproteobacteria bacterium]